ncbi:unnamed protein product, partial [Discosporangium mesarthrocarpum]
ALGSYGRRRRDSPGSAGSGAGTSAGMGVGMGAGVPSPKGGFEFDQSDGDDNSGDNNRGARVRARAVVQGPCPALRSPPAKAVTPSRESLGNPKGPKKIPLLRESYTEPSPAQTRPRGAVGPGNLRALMAGEQDGTGSMATGGPAGPESPCTAMAVEGQFRASPVRRPGKSGFPVVGLVEK